VNGASNNIGTSIRVVLTTLEESIIEQSFTLGFYASNNEAEYEAVLAGLRMGPHSGSQGSKFDAIPH